MFGSQWLSTSFSHLSISIALLAVIGCCGDGTGVISTTQFSPVRLLFRGTDFFSSLGVFGNFGLLPLHRMWMQNPSSENGSLGKIYSHCDVTAELPDWAACAILEFCRERRKADSQYRATFET
jgi:hypothetical protein